MNEQPISRFPVAATDDLPEVLRGRIDEIEEKTGFVPNVFRAMAWRPEELEAFMGLHDALMDKEGGLSKAEREMIVVATSAANDCLYCVVAHGAILRIRTKDPLIAEQIATNYRKAPLSGRERAMLDFALKTADRSAEIDDGDLAALDEAGFSEDEIWDIGAIAALFAYSNRLANLASIMPNREFYDMAR